MKINTFPRQGTRDLSPKEVNLRNYVMNTILQTYQKAGFLQIETPAMESMDFLASGQGGENEKLIFKILHRGEKLNLQKPDLQEHDVVDCGLRFDLTVPLTRFYANKKSELPNPFKVIQFGSVWRAERPQKGRFRQFVQCDIDIFGMESILAETELVLATSQALLNLGFRNFKVRINSRLLLENLAAECNFPSQSYGKVFILLDKLDKIGLDGVEKELLAENFAPDSVNKLIGIIKNLTAQKITVSEIKNALPNAPREVLEDLDFLLQTVQNQADNLFEICYDLSLVRGMGYYTGTIFEVEMADYGSSVGGGGRYDKMVGKMLKEDVPACGFSIGFERIIQILEEKNFQIPDQAPKIAFIYDGQKQTFSQILPEVKKLRAEGKMVLLDIRQKNLGKQLNRLAEQGCTDFCNYFLDKPLEIKALTKS
ncbi:MAG: histidine--tRNA ligase [Bacteroidetes bacterium]|nr:MAG: histidine--tRNA ligase [Bacteroidota bacterium]